MTEYARIIEEGRYFEAVSFSAEDLGRAALYAENSQRDAFEAKFADYGEYLDSLEMVAEIAPFKPVYLERIAQLTNKTNQFNLTTRRYTLAEMEQRANDPNCIALYGKLKDRFGDYGLISVVLGHRTGDALEIDLWLMSCRVLKRGMEAAMLDTLVEAAQSRRITELRGTYLPTAKNAMVAEFYPSLGFQREAEPSKELPEGATRWSLDLRGYSKQNRHIQRMEFSHV